MSSSNYITTYLSAGLAADIPAAPTPGTPSTGSVSLYYEDDTGIMKAWDGSAWVSTNPIATDSVAGLVIPDGTIITVASNGDITVPEATASVLGVVKVDNSTIQAATGVISLKNTAVTAGSYTLADITVDAQGRITAASDGSASGGTVNITDGVNTVSAATSITFTGTGDTTATVSGTNPNATVTINSTGGGGSSTQFLPAAGAPANPTLSGLTKWSGAGTATATFTQNGSGGTISIVNFNDPHPTPVGILVPGTLATGDLWACAIDYISSNQNSGDQPSRFMGLSDGTKLEGWSIDTGVHFGDDSNIPTYASSSATSGGSNVSGLTAVTNFYGGRAGTTYNTAAKMWFAIGNDGTNINYYYSTNGVNFVLFGYYPITDSTLSSFSDFFVGYNRANADSGWTAIVNIHCIDMAAQNRTVSNLFPN